ncbi:hydantoinase/oxoprolinase family protein [Lichenifustis flavocetrariae]|uniref:Hydantoinase/oxoprolinase family protein n=1 Tax=Lichenifustis flavocetrariae TaxID=2949735 RepID=A0AA41Z2F5_9HYPH|nr:hydantoinase/oxoprolinase family protein [Lichenifustis flavocetrariae]MCW6509278.1 hydantoinase/oxoprolinase family protein [Lichenifustis flavocetrariae]
MKRVGIDIGGTFTDIVVFDEETGAVTRSKTPSVPSAPEQGFMTALSLAEVALDQVRTLVHGTTIVTNLILERKGAKVALITTKGFRDILEIMRATRPLPYDLAWRKPQPLIPRSLCFEVDERLMASGEVATPIDRAAVEDVVRKVLAEGVEGIAVSLLHSYRNDSHERLVADVIRSLAPDMPLSVSSVVCREIREYERTNTTVANVYAMPRVRRYVAALRDRVGSAGLVNYLSSEGGLQPGQEASDRPVSLCVSGPAGGVLGGAFVGQLTGRKNLITVDMGGTSFDVAVIRDGRFELKNTFEIEWGLPVKTPTIDIKTIGAGGGSIVWVDEGGALQVGPQSAGAEPGPACYGRGGTACTVTDANLVLGLIKEDGLMPLHRDRAEAALRSIADRFGLSVQDAAAGIYRVVNASMASAIRQMTVEKGIDPREFALVPFGGAGGQHAAVLAADVGISEILVPTMASVFSAYGMVSAPIKISRSRTVMAALDDLRWTDLNDIFADLASDIASVESGRSAETRRFEYSLDMKYAKQAHEINVLIEPDWSPSQVVDAFEARHFALYGTRLGHKTAVVTARLTAVAALPPLEPQSGHARPDRKPKPVRTTDMPGVGSSVAVFDRTELWPGMHVDGPCLVEEYDTSFFVPSGATGRVDPYRNLIVRIDGSQGAPHGA